MYRSNLYLYTLNFNESSYCTFYIYRVIDIILQVIRKNNSIFNVFVIIKTIKYINKLKIMYG